ncbi:MAG: CIA30 family protein [Methyloligellaceae bacterium]
MKFALCLGMVAPFLKISGTVQARDTALLIDNFSSSDLISKLGTPWRGVSDQVMGGVSQGQVNHDSILGRNCLRIRGNVRLDNNGGFIQAALDLRKSRGLLDASSYKGIRLAVYGNDEKYSLHLRTPDNTRPWQSYRAHFSAQAAWSVIDLPFAEFEPYRTQRPLDISRLRRLGLVAIGRDFTADLAVSEIGFYS